MRKDSFPWELDETLEEHGELWQKICGARVVLGRGFGDHERSLQSSVFEVTVLLVIAKILGVLQFTGTPHARRFREFALVRRIKASLNAAHRGGVNVHALSSCLHFLPRTQITYTTVW